MRLRTSTLAIGLLVGLALPALADDVTMPDVPLPAIPDATTALPALPGTGSRDTSGALLIHGNYCGPGNRGMNKAPVDALDAACRRHDACTPDGGLPKCSCNSRLVAESAAVAQDPRQPPDLQVLAGNVSAGAQLLPCEQD